jgi:hypothetical protein
MMRPLSAEMLLAVWEENWQRPPLWRGLALLAAACPEEGQEALLALSMGAFNAHLLMLHACSFGPTLLSSACPHCGRAWSAFLDVASFVWREVETWAQRTLQEIHLLARAYGWREIDILTLTPTRRQAYLQMVYG